MHPSDTIVAISSAIASDAMPAARMIVRVAGPNALRLSSQFIECFQPLHGSAAQHTLTIDNLPVRAWVYTFLAPRSYTGDDLIELHLPGNALLARMTVDSFIAAGARLAEPGEFTARAFLNGRLDLPAAEGVALAVSATQESELRAARQLMSGELARRLSPHLETLVETLALLETGIDFSDQDVTFIDVDEIRRRVGRMHDDLTRLLNESPQFERLTHRPRFVLMGRPNAGKSTLLNALAGHQRAVVSPVAGTTRDVLSAEVKLASGIVDVTDVAGLDHPADDTIERQMQHHARRGIEEADFAIHVIDSAAPNESSPLPRPADLVVMSKSDLASAAGGIAISAKTGAGLERLRSEMNRLAFGTDTAGSRVALNSRHRAAIERALDHLATAAAVAETAELAAHDLRAALDALGSVLGQVTPDDVLGRVFATFCIGK